MREYDLYISPIIILTPSKRRTAVSVPYEGFLFSLGQGSFQGLLGGDPRARDRRM